jgi:invasion protein IalB
MLAALRKGQQLTIDFKDVTKKQITVPLSLAGFAEAYDGVNRIIRSSS